MIDARNNYWGTGDSSAISALIFDYFDDIDYETVDFADFLSAPDTSAPAP